MSIPQKVEKLINDSGNSFHAKVTRWFASNGWDTIISPYYMDQSQQKARELDLIAEKLWPIMGGRGDWQGDVAARLFIECKFLPGYSVFWFTDKDKSKIKEALCAVGTYELMHRYTEQHHHLSCGERVAKLFASEKGRNQEGDPFYKALNQSLNGLVSMSGQPPRVFTRGRGGEGSRVILNFPVVICNSFSNLYAADFNGTRDTAPVSENFQIEVQYAYINETGRSCNELFLLDVVEFDRLPQFIEAIGVDADVAGFFARSD